MRSAAEIAFRLRQEAINLARFLFPVKAPLRAAMQPAWPLPDAGKSARLVLDTRIGDEIIALAGEILAHRFPIFGGVVDTGAEIDWHRDYRSGKISGLEFSRRVRYLDFASVGDSKWTWELNRHQHLIVLAQAFRLTGRHEFLAEIEAQIVGWTARNPFVRGINWASALEVAFRALSWMWVDHLAGSELRPEIRLLLQNGLWFHARHLEVNLSTYFSPNTHLLGEAVALHAIGVNYPAMPGAAGFARTGGRLVEEQLEFQVRGDGSHFEQSTYYHVYALDFFLFHYLLAGRPASMKSRLGKMAEYLGAVIGPSRRLFFLGDDDGGRFFHPYGERDLFARATLATCALALPGSDICFEERDALVQAAWWVGDVAEPRDERRSGGSRNFADSGLVTLVNGPVQVLFDAGPFGWSGAGHSHADALEILVRHGDRVLLGDAGTFVYTADIAQRNWFRGTAAHNTVVIDGRDQATPVTPFRWEDKPVVRLMGVGNGYADAECEYGGFVHRRTVLLCAARACVVLDRITGPAGEHAVEQVWNGEMLTSAPQMMRQAWRSECYGTRGAIEQTVASKRGEFPMVMAAALVFGDGAGALSLAMEAGACVVQVAGITAVFPDSGEPRWSETVT